MSAFYAIPSAVDRYDLELLYHEFLRKMQQTNFSIQQKLLHFNKND